MMHFAKRLLHVLQTSDVFRWSENGRQLRCRCLQTAIVPLKLSKTTTLLRYMNMVGFKKSTETEPDGTLVTVFKHKTVTRANVHDALLEYTMMTPDQRADAVDSWFDPTLQFLDAVPMKALPVEFLSMNI